MEGGRPTGERWAEARARGGRCEAAARACSFRKSHPATTPHPTPIAHSPPADVSTSQTHRGLGRVGRAARRAAERRSQHSDGGGR